MMNKYLESMIVFFFVVLLGLMFAVVVSVSGYTVDTSLIISVIVSFWILDKYIEGLK